MFITYTVDTDYTKPFQTTVWCHPGNKKPEGGHTIIYCAHHPGGPPSMLYDVAGITGTNPRVTKGEETELRAHGIGTIRINYKRSETALRSPITSMHVFRQFSRTKRWWIKPCKQTPPCGLQEIVTQIIDYQHREPERRGQRPQ